MFDEHDAAVRSMLRRVSIGGVDDSGSQQRLTLNGLKGEEFKRVVRVHDHGFASHPPSGAEGILLAQGGRSDRAWAMGFEHQKYRAKDLPEGASALYDTSGNIIRLLTKDGVKFDFDKSQWVAKAKGVTITTNGDHITVDPGGKNVYVGTTSAGSSARVMTESGPSANVFAKI